MLDCFYSCCFGSEHLNLKPKTLHLENGGLLISLKSIPRNTVHAKAPARSQYTKVPKFQSFKVLKVMQCFFCNDSRSPRLDHGGAAKGREGFISVFQRTLNQQFLWARAPPNSCETSTVLHADALLSILSACVQTTLIA